MFYVQIDPEMVPAVIPLLSADSRRAGVSCKRKYVHGVLVTCNRLV